MQVILAKVGKENIYLLNRYPSEIKNGRLEAFVRSAKNHKGWQKITKWSFVENVELPDIWDKSISWLYIAKLYDQYGIEVANQYAECKTAGIVSRQTARGYGGVYQAIKHLPPVSDEFFEFLRCDYRLSCFGMFTLDLVGMDKAFGQKDEDYNPIACKYKGTQCSTKEYVQLKFGDNAVTVIETLSNEVMV